MLAAISDEILAVWVRAWNDIEAELLTEWPGWTERRIQLEEARRVAAQKVIQAAEETGVILTQNARAMIERGLWEQPMLLEPQLPPELRASILFPPAGEVDRMVERVTQQITATTYVLSVEASEAVRRSLVLGLAGGENPREVARRMIEMVEGPFNGGVARAQVIARTEMIDAHRDATKLAQDANADILQGWYWYTNLDLRTCPSCVEQHGKLHPLDQPGPLDHQQGRCARLPAVKPWRELGIDVDGPPGPDIGDGHSWFLNLTPDQQRQVLGPKRYDAWLAGDYPMNVWSVRRSTEGWRDSFGVGPVKA